MRRNVLWLLLILFLVTRLPLGWLAARPDVYIHDGINTSSDVTLYEGWANELIDNANGAYSGVRIEYPPGSLPFILGPRIAPGDTSYLVGFVIIMALIDAAGFGGLIVMAKRWGSSAGPMLWIFAIAALGPIAYLRLDIVPAVATIWALERASSNDWMGSGGWFGVAAIAKLYALLFIPAGFILAPQRRRYTIAALVVFVAPLVPLLPVLDDVISSVLGYHVHRGIQVESLWGALLFVVQRTGTDLFVAYSFGALHFGGDLAESVRAIAPYVSLAGLASGTALAFRLRGRREPGKAFAEVCFVILALALTTGTVFSPQFLLWLFALGAGVCCISDSPLRFWSIALIPIAVVTQAIFPFSYNQLLFAGIPDQPLWPLVLLWIRNLAIAAIAIGGAIVLFRANRKPLSDPSIPEPASA